jgi:hypothetical protein
VVSAPPTQWTQPWHTSSTTGRTVSTLSRSLATMISKVSVWRIQLSGSGKIKWLRELLMLCAGLLSEQRWRFSEVGGRGESGDGRMSSTKWNNLVFIVLFSVIRSWYLHAIHSVINYLLCFCYIFYILLEISPKAMLENSIPPFNK